MRGVVAVPLLILALSFVGCAAEHATDQERDTVIRTSLSCMIAAADELDDHKSDAVTVAYGILGRCNRELMEEYETAGKGFSFDNQHSIKRKLEANNLKSATAIVLKERAQGKTQ